MQYIIKTTKKKWNRKLVFWLKDVHKIPNMGLKFDSQERFWLVIR